MGIFSKIFTWWNGATIGTSLFSSRYGEHVGTDVFGNKYYRAKGGKVRTTEGYDKRWIIYAGPNDASSVPAEWFGWLHHQYDGVPESHLPPPRIWEVDYTPNATGTDRKYLPQGALERGGHRAAATGDYEAWSPEA